MSIKRILVFILTLVMIFSSCIITSFAEPSISAKSAVLMLCDTGEVVFSKNLHERRPMASTTKIMTALIVLENCDLLKTVIVTPQMTAAEGTSMGLQPGDKVTVKDLIYGMLLKSGNDAANALAITCAENIPNFLLLMNKKAKEIGMNNTNFETPSGLDSKKHYSTSYDMALLAREALKNPQFSYICSRKIKEVYFGSPQERRVLKNHNRLLTSYDGAEGVKTGFTKKSGRCLVSCAARNGVKLIAVTLNAPNDWKDHEKLLDYGFSVTKSKKINSKVSSLYIKVVGAEKEKVKLSLGKEPTIAVLKGNNIKVKEEILLKRFEYAPLDKGQIVGEARYYYENKLFCTVPIITSENAKQSKIIELKKGK